MLSPLALPNTSSAASAPRVWRNMTFDYDWTKAGDTLLEDFIGLGGTTENLIDTWIGEKAQIADSAQFEMDIGASGGGITVSSLDEVKSTGSIQIHVAPDAPAVLGGHAVRVHRLAVVLEGLDISVELHAQKTESSVYRLGSRLVRLPYANILDGAGDGADQTGQATLFSLSTPALLGGDGEVLEDINEPQFGLSFEGTWQLRISNQYSAADYQAILEAITGGKVVFRTFGQS